MSGFRASGQMTCDGCGWSQCETIDEALEQAGNGDGFIMPRGAALLPQVENDVNSEFENMYCA